MKTSGWELNSLPQGAKALGEYICVGLVSTRFLESWTARAGKGLRGHKLIFFILTPCKLRTKEEKRVSSILYAVSVLSVVRNGLDQFLFFIIAQEPFQTFFLITPSNEISIPQIFGYLLYTIDLFICYIHTKSNIVWIPKNQYLPPWGRYCPCWECMSQRDQMWPGYLGLEFKLRYWIWCSKQ